MACKKSQNWLECAPSQKKEVILEGFSVVVTELLGMTQTIKLYPAAFTDYNRPFGMTSTKILRQVFP